MVTSEKSYVDMEPCTTVLSADPHTKGETQVDQQKIMMRPYSSRTFPVLDVTTWRWAG